MLVLALVLVACGGSDADEEALNFTIPEGAPALSAPEASDPPGDAGDPPDEPIDPPDEPVDPPDEPVDPPPAPTGGTDAASLARDFCDLISVFADIDEDDFEAFLEVMIELEEREQEFYDLEERFDASGLSEDELEAAIWAECPAAFAAFDDF